MGEAALPVPTRELRCVRCGAVNRVGAYGLDKLPRCGKCQTALPEPSVRRLQRKVRTHWRWVTVAALLAGAVWWNPIFLKDLFAKREQSPAEKAAEEYCARFPQPATGVQAVYDPDEQVSSLTIKTSAGGGYFVKLVGSISGNVAMTFFIVGGETLRTSVPEGSFVLRYATGDRWCGAVNLFGRETVVKQTEKTFFFDEGRGYTVELIARKGGNLRTRTVDRGQF